MNSLKANQPGCLQTTLNVLGDKWSGRILDDLSSGPQTFSALEVALAHISPRTLSHRLEMLAREAIIEKRQYCEHPPRYKYLLTAKGVELQEVLAKMAEWGAKYHKESVTHRCDSVEDI